MTSQALTEHRLMSGGRLAAARAVKKEQDVNVEER